MSPSTPRAFSGSGRVLGTGAQTVTMTMTEPPSEVTNQSAHTESSAALPAALSSNVSHKDIGGSINADTTRMDIGGPGKVVTLVEEKKIEVTKDFKYVHRGQEVDNTMKGNEITAKGDCDIVVRGGAPQTTQDPLLGITPQFLQFLPGPALAKMLQKYLQSQPDHALASLPAETLEAMDADPLRGMLIGLLPASVARA